MDQPPCTLTPCSASPSYHANTPPVIDGGHLTHSLGGFVCKIDSPHGRKKDSMWWEGIYKTFYWMDPTTGVTVSSWSLSVRKTLTHTPGCVHHPTVCVWRTERAV